VFAGGEFVTLAIVRTVDSMRGNVHLSGNAIRADIPSPIIGAEYRLTVENLPSGYSVKSMTFGTTDLRTDTLKLTTSNFSQLQTLSTPPAPGVVVIGNCGAPSQANGTATFSVLAGTGNVLSLLNPQAAVSCISGPANSSVAITLEAPPASVSPAPGARISGKMPFLSGDWAIYSDNDPGMLFADGTFEMRGVSPGRHIVTMQSFGNPPQYYSALLTVADKDIGGVTLESIDVWPSNPTTLAVSTDASNAGWFRAPAGLRGRVVEEAGGKPLKSGVVTILGKYMTTTSINADGKFIFPHLLPGSYDLRIESYEHFSLYETVVIGEENVDKNFAIRSSLSDEPK